MEKRVIVGIVLVLGVFFVLNAIRASGVQPGPILFIDKPQGIYGTGRVWLDIEFSGGLATMEYALDTQRPQRLCSKCTSYQGYKAFSDGKHTFSVVATDGLNNKYYATSAFTVDTIRPRILGVEPKNYAKGEFKVKYTEPNLKLVTLFFGSNSDTSGSCNSGECSFVESLIEGSVISYYFELIDAAGNMARSNTVKVKVDSTEPIITVMKPEEGSLYRRNVEFVLGANERLKRLSYKVGTIEKTLCASCQYYNGRQAIAAGNQLITFYAEDFAGNIGTSVRRVEVI